MNSLEMHFDPVRRYVEAADSVIFFARLGPRTVRCYPTRSALNACFGTDPRAPEPAGECLKAFDRSIDRIRELALRRIGRRGGDASTLVITSDDVRHAAGLRP